MTRNEERTLSKLNNICFPIQREEEKRLNGELDWNVLTLTENRPC